MADHIYLTLVVNPKCAGPLRNVIVPPHWILRLRDDAKKPQKSDVPKKKAKNSKRVKKVIFMTYEKLFIIRFHKIWIGTSWYEMEKPICVYQTAPVHKTFLAKLAQFAVTLLTLRSVSLS